MDSANGRFELVEAGVEDSVESARAAAFDAVIRNVDWFELIRRALQTHWLDTSQLNQALRRNQSPPLGAMSHLDAFHCLDWLENHRGADVIRLCAGPVLPLLLFLPAQYRPAPSHLQNIQKD